MMRAVRQAWVCRRRDDRWWCAGEAVITCALGVLALLGVVAWVFSQSWFHAASPEVPLAPTAVATGDQWSPICPGVTRAEVVDKLELSSIVAIAIPEAGLTSMLNGIALKPTEGESSVQIFSRLALDVCEGTQALRWYDIAG